MVGPTAPDSPLCASTRPHLFFLDHPRQMRVHHAVTPVEDLARDSGISTQVWSHYDFSPESPDLCPLSHLKAFKEEGVGVRGGVGMASISPVMIFHVECLEYQDLTIWGFGQIIATSE